MCFCSSDDEYRGPPLTGWGAGNYDINAINAQRFHNHFGNPANGPFGAHVAAVGGFHMPGGPPAGNAHAGGGGQGQPPQHEENPDEFDLGMMGGHGNGQGNGGAGVGAHGGVGGVFGAGGGGNGLHYIPGGGDMLYDDNGNAHDPADVGPINAGFFDRGGGGAGRGQGRGNAHFGADPFDLGNGFGRGRGRGGFGRGAAFGPGAGRGRGGGLPNGYHPGMPNIPGLPRAGTHMGYGKYRPAL